MPLIVDEWSYGRVLETSATEICASAIGRFIRLFVNENIRHTYHQFVGYWLCHAAIQCRARTVHQGAVRSPYR